jgi:SAM-dependent methyltransferase
MNHDSETYKKLYEMYGFPHLTGERGAELPFLLDVLPEPPARVLDIGCRHSILPVLLNRTGYECWGMDVNADYPDSIVPYIKADCRDLTVLAQVFDVVTCISTIEHIGLRHSPYGTEADADEKGDAMTAVKEMASKVKKGGKLILTFPCGDGDSVWFGHADWITFFKKEQIGLMTDMLHDRHFVVNVSYSVTTDDGWKEVGEDEALSVYSEENPDGARAICLL